MKTSDKLLLLINLREQSRKLDQDMLQKINATISKEQAEQMADIKAEYSPLLQTVNNNIAKLEEEIKAEVIAAGATLSVPGARATFVKGKTSWDGKLLEGYAVAHPEINQAKTVGQPYVFIKIGGKDADKDAV